METTKRYLNTENFDKALIKENLNRIDFCKVSEMKYDKINKLVQNRQLLLDEDVSTISTLLNVKPEEIISYQKIDYKSYNSPFARKPKANKTSKKIVNSHAVGMMNFDVLSNRLHEMGSSFQKMIDIMGISSSYRTRWKTVPVSEKFANKICKYTGLTKAELCMPIEENKTEPVNNSANTVIAETSAESTEKYEYKSFSGTNLMENFAIMNENILTLAKEVGVLKKDIVRLSANVNVQANSASERYEEISKGFNALLQKMDKLTTVDNRPKAIAPVKPEKKLTVWSNVSDDPKKCADSYSEEDSLDVYKIKLSNMIKYICKKEGKIYTQVCVDVNARFEEIYGVNIKEEKKIYAKNKDIPYNNNIPVAEVLYANPFYRNIYFNLFASKVSEYYAS